MSVRQTTRNQFHKLLVSIDLFSLLICLFYWFVYFIDLSVLLISPFPCFVYYSAPGDKKPIMSVNGEWNGIMYATYPNQKDPQVFVDTFNMPIVKKQVQSIPKQQTFESRRYNNLQLLFSFILHQSHSTDDQSCKTTPKVFLKLDDA